MKTTVRQLAALTLISMMSLPAYPQQQPESPRLSENMDVRIINIDVVVTDRRGTIITGLDKDDFLIFENGQPKPISNFYAVEGSRPVVAEATTNIPATTTATTVPIPPEELSDNLKKRIIFYIDNLSLAPFNRNRVFTQMKEFIKTTLRPGDEAMIATFNRSMKVRVPFTKDTTTLNQMLDSIAGESALGTANTSERKQTEDRIRDAQTYDEAIATARTYSASIEHDLRQSAASLTGLMTTLAGLEGKKVLVLTSEGFPMQPGREMFQFIDEMAKEKNWQFTGTLLEGMTYDSTTLIQSIARTANANGITMYTIHAAGLTGGNEMSAENARPTPVSVSNALITNTTESMQIMAEMTGGLASARTNNFAEAFRKIGRDLDSYYSLGYRAGTERVDRQRYIQVKLKEPKGLIVRSRQTFVEKSTFAEMSDRVIANLLYKTRENDLKILVRTGRPEAGGDGLYTVPVEIQIPMDSLTLLPQGETSFAGGFDVYVAVADKNNDLSDVSRKTHELRVSAEDMARAKGKHYTYTLDLLMEKGLNRISIGIVDNVTNQSGFAREQVLAQDLR